MSIPAALQLANGRALPTPDPNTDGVQTLQNDGTNQPRWVAAGAATGLQILTSDPFPSVEGTFWCVGTGSAPTASIELRAYRDGATHVVASVSY